MCSTSTEVTEAGAGRGQALGEDGQEHARDPRTQSPASHWKDLQLSHGWTWEAME